jgi:osmotically-inducible protein OsmY
MDSRTLSLLMMISLGGCAAMARYDGEVPEPDTAAVHAYRSVRSDGAMTARAGAVVFCATQSGLEALLADGRSSDEWSAKSDEKETQNSVRGALKVDPELRHEPISAKLVNGEAYLSGKLSSDQRATLAIYDALRVLGVASVHASFVTPESPTPMIARGPEVCGEMHVVTRMR